MYDVITFGARSAGMSLVTGNILSPYGFAINPVMHYAAFADGAVLSATTPDFAVDELLQPAYIYPLGSEQEYLLYNVLYYTVNSTLPGMAN